MRKRKQTTTTTFKTVRNVREIEREIEYDNNGW